MEEDEGIRGCRCCGEGREKRRNKEDIEKIGREEGRREERVI